MLFLVHRCSRLLLHNLVTYCHAAMLMFMLTDMGLMPKLLMETLRMPVIMHHHGDRLVADHRTDADAQQGPAGEHQRDAAQ